MNGEEANMSVLPEVAANGDHNEPELNNGQQIHRPTGGDLLRLVYELPKEFTDGTWDAKSNAENVAVPQNQNSDTGGGINITSHVRAKIEEMTNTRSATTNISLMDVMNSNNALRLKTNKRNQNEELTDSVFSSDDDCDKKVYSNQTISVTECSGPNTPKNTSSISPSTNNKAERNSYSGSPTPKSMPLSPTPYHSGSNRNCSSSPVDPTSDLSDEDVESFNRTLSNNTELLEKWLREKASPEILKKVHAITETTTPIVNSGSKRTSVTSELFQLWLASSPVKVKLQFIFVSI